MWLLQFLPDSMIVLIANTVFVLGVLGTVLFFFAVNRFLRLLPVFAGYLKLGQLISAVLLVVGIFLQGAITTEMKWRERVKQVEAQLDEAKQKSQETNVKIQERVIYRDRIVKERSADIVNQLQQQIETNQELKNFAQNCPVPPELIDAHNAAATLNQTQKSGTK
jgi:hypothetical protein